MKQVNSITDNQQKILNEIVDYIRTEQRSPTTRELQERLGIKSPRSVAQYLEALERAGYIRRGHGARNIHVLTSSAQFQKEKDGLDPKCKKSPGTPPVAFISYSHDSPEHKQWVEKLATRLREAGVNAVLDKWHLEPGSDVTLFMEKGVRDADRVLVVCTDAYIRKAEAGIGGVGFERLIVTAELIEDIGTTKFIPVVKDTTGTKKTPSFLATRFRIETKNNEISNEDFQTLLRALHNLSPRQPPLGKNPFGGEQSNQLSETLPDIDISTGSPLEIYNTAVQLTRRVDLAGWHQLVKRTRGPVQQALLEWRVHVEKTQAGSEEWQKRVDRSLQCASPLFALALAGLESGRPEFSDQRGLFDDLYNIGGWSRAGLTSIVKLPTALGYFYHSLHGAMSTLMGNYDAALKLADIVVKVGEAGHYAPIHRHHGLMGWTSALNNSVSDSWTFLSEAADRWPWLQNIFSRTIEYRIGLTAYYILLSLNELVSDIAETQKYQIRAPFKGLPTDIPLCFATEAPEITEKAVSLLQSHPEMLQLVWERKGVKAKQVIDLWEGWIKASKNWVEKVYEDPFFDYLPHASLLMTFQGRVADRT